MIVQPVLWWGVADRHGELMAVEEGEATAIGIAERLNTEAKRVKYAAVPVAVLPPEIGVAVYDLAVKEAT